MRIEEAFQNKFFIRNCGNGVITNNTLNVYVDGELINFNLTSSSIDGGKTGTLIVRSWGLSVGQHALRITNPNVETSTLFEATLPESCVLALDFDEDSGTITYDSSGYENDGTLYGNTNWVAGKFDNALHFDGTDDYVEVSDSSELNPINALSVEAWIKPEVLNRDMTIVDKVDGGIPDKGYNLFIGYNWYGLGETLIYFQVRTGGAYFVNCSIEEANKWYHIVGAYDNSLTSDNLKLYINDELCDKTDITNPIEVTDQPIYIGGEPGTQSSNNQAGEDFIGIIDSVRIFNRALTPDETLNLRII
jgi:hypothetical protein